MTIIYTDGACKGNGKKDSGSLGGYGVYIEYDDGRIQKIWGGEKQTTNNRMELMAAINALLATADTDSVTLYTDSNYVKNGIQTWMIDWKNNHWRKKDGKPPQNLDLWQQLDNAAQGRIIDWQWVKGHSGNVGNETADSLANQGVHSFGNEITQKSTPPTDKKAKIQTKQKIPTAEAKSAKTGVKTPSQSQKTSAMPDEPSLQTAESQGFDDSYFIDTDDSTNNSTIDSDYNSPSYFDDSGASIDTLANDRPDDSGVLADNKPTDFDGDTSRHNPHFVPILPHPINKNKPERQLIIDTETTGFDDKGGDRIVEIGAIEMVGRKMTGQKLHVYLDPEKQMDEEVIKVHGISNEFVKDKPKFAEVAQKVYDFFEGAELIAHNAVFDMRFLSMEFERAGLPDFEEKVHVIDSLALAKHYYPGQKNSLDMLVKRLNVGKKDRTFHGALLDSEILGEVYLAMTGGQVSLAIDIDEAMDSQSVASFENFSDLSSLLVKTNIDTTEDTKWRQTVLS